ncbi:MAG: T9SS type A sorting domain-containing protein [Adhaeribacter sp.]
MKGLPVAILLVLLSCHLRALAQQQYAFRFRNDVKIVIDSDTIKDPWAGGLNSPVFSKIELNNDGTEDLFVYDRTLDKIFTYVAQNKNGQWQWQYAPEYERLFPRDLTGWVLLRDYNQDGRKDIFTKTNAGIKVYKNTTGANGIPAFTQAVDYIRFNNNINLQASSENLPALLDMDNDGDLDILTFDFSGSTTVEYYKNLAVEENLPTDNLKYTLETNWWGKLTKCPHVCNGYLFNSSCRTDGTNHNDGMNLLALDLDGDSDKDILVGGEACPDLARITNSGTLTNAVLASSGLQLNYPGNTTRASFNYFPAAYYEDVNFDNQPDLLVAPFVRSNINDDVNFTQSSWLYKNISATQVPAFEFQQRDFLQANMVDTGEQSVPALADVDADGDLDLLLGNRTGSIWFFRNVGTATKAIFKLETKDYLTLTGAGFRDIKPQFADINSDGRLDLILAGTTGNSGAIKYILNTAGINQPFNYAVTNIKTLPVGQNIGDVPAFYDLDNDGDQDLILASNVRLTPTSGPLRFYRNTGTAANPNFTLENEAWGNIPAELNRQNSYPIITDLNKDKSPELLLVDDTGEIRIFSNIRQNLNGTFTPATDILQNPLTQTFEPSKLGNFLALAAGDLNADGMPEIIIGTRAGGLHYLSQQMRGEIVNPEPLPEQTEVVIYPNPVNRDLTLTIQSPERVTFTLYNLAGQRINIAANELANIHRVRVAGLTPGLYLVQVITADFRRKAYKVVVL